MGSTGRNVGVGNTGGTLSAAQSEVVSMSRDYNEETLQNFKADLNEAYDDRAYVDPYFNTDEYEDTMDGLLGSLRQEITNLRTEAERKSYRYWSQEYANEEYRAAARLQELYDDYMEDYRRQQYNGGRR